MYKIRRAPTVVVEHISIIYRTTSSNVVTIIFSLQNSNITNDLNWRAMEILLVFQLLQPIQNFSMEVVSVMAKADDLAFTVLTLARVSSTLVKSLPNLAL